MLNPWSWSLVAPQEDSEKNEQCMHVCSRHLSHASCPAFSAADAWFAGMFLTRCWSGDVIQPRLCFTVFIFACLFQLKSPLLLASVNCKQIIAYAKLSNPQLCSSRALFFTDLRLYMSKVTLAWARLLFLGFVCVCARSLLFAMYWVQNTHSTSEVGAFCCAPQFKVLFDHWRSFKVRGECVIQCTIQRWKREDVCMHACVLASEGAERSERVSTASPQSNLGALDKTLRLWSLKKKDTLCGEQAGDRSSRGAGRRE